MILAILFSHDDGSSNVRMRWLRVATMAMEEDSQYRRQSLHTLPPGRESKRSKSEESVRQRNLEEELIQDSFSRYIGDVLRDLNPSQGSYSDGVPLRMRLDGYEIDVLEAEDIEVREDGVLRLFFKPTLRKEVSMNPNAEFCKTAILAVLRLCLVPVLVVQHCHIACESEACSNTCDRIAVSACCRL